ncbi:MAG: hypothetical protein ACLQPD_07960 [Desulfomonilaceae bacterium]
MILTSSCDLVLRPQENDLYEARFLTLVPVYPLDLVLEQHLDMEQSSIEKKAKQSSKKLKGDLITFLRKLINNNLPEYFFLPQSTTKDINFPVNSCAVLRQAFSIRLDYKYFEFQSARVASLTDVFVAKLGFLIGELYSRVATEDVIPVYMPDFKNKLNAWVNGLSNWEDSDMVSRAITAARDQNVLNGLLKATREEVRSFIQQYSKEQMFDRAVKEIIKILEKQNLPICDEQKQKFRGDLLKDNKLKEFIK